MVRAQADERLSAADGFAELGSRVSSEHLAEVGRVGCGAGGPFIVLSAAHWALLRAWVEDNGRLEEQ